MKKPIVVFNFHKKRCVSTQINIKTNAKRQILNLGNENGLFLTHGVDATDLRGGLLPLKVSEVSHLFIICVRN